jgi:hypothetical protein
MIKNKVPFFALLLLFFIPVFFVSAQNPQYPIKENVLQRNVILELARLYSTSVRSAKYSVVAFNVPNTPHICVQFGFEGQFEITISDEQTEYYNNVISIFLSPNGKKEKLNISISSLKPGNYTFTIKDLSSQKSSSGKFSIK